LKTELKFISSKLDTNAPISVVSLRRLLKKKKKDREIFIINIPGTRIDSSYCKNKKYAGFISE